MPIDSMVKFFESDAKLSAGKNKKVKSFAITLDALLGKALNFSSIKPSDKNKKIESIGVKLAKNISFIIIVLF